MNRCESRFEQKVAKSAKILNNNLAYFASFCSRNSSHVTSKSTDFSAKKPARQEHYANAGAERYRRRS